VLNRHIICWYFCSEWLADIPLEFVQCQWRLVAEINGGAAPENWIFFINWGMATDIELKDYILYKYKERIKEKGTIILYVIDNIKWQ
jgi:hypothetical protein